MDLNADLSTLILDAETIIAALAVAIIATGVVNYRIVFGPGGKNIKNPSTQILLAFLIFLVFVKIYPHL